MGLFPASFALASVPPSFGLISGETVLHFPCAAGVGKVVEVGTAYRHGYAWHEGISLCDSHLVHRQTGLIMQFHRQR